MTYTNLAATCDTMKETISCNV